MTPIELFKGLFISYNENVATIFDLRFPRIFIAILGGAATAVSGVLLQAVMKNPLADPGIIGMIRNRNGDACYNFDDLLYCANPNRNQ